LIGLQELIKPPQLPKNVQFVFRKSSPLTFRDTLRDIKSRNIYSMVVDAKPDSLPKLLTADIEIFELENFKYNFVNMTAYRLVDSSNFTVRHVLREVEKFQPKGQPILNRTNVIQAGPALMFDSVFALAKGLHSLQQSAPPLQLKSSNASCEGEVAWIDGTSLFNYINSVRSPFAFAFLFHILFHPFQYANCCFTYQ
ncbi:glutamate receptor: ionotropic kainate 2-like protein 2, partial [Leptotrombidium deliense]